MTDHIQIGDVSPRVRYAANGADTEFAFAFPIFRAADLAVYVDGVARTTGFTVSGAGQTEGGTITFDAAPTEGAAVVLVRRLAIQRTTDFQESGEFRAKAINDELDYQTAALQQVADDMARSLRLDPTDVSVPGTLPTRDLRANRFLAFDGDGAPIAAAGPGEVPVSAPMEPLVQAPGMAEARAVLGLVVGADVLAPDGDGSRLTGIVTGATPTERANILLNAFRIAVNGGLSVRKMIDGVVDEFEDDFGVEPDHINCGKAGIAYFDSGHYTTNIPDQAFDGDPDNGGWVSQVSVNASNGVSWCGVQLAAAIDLTKARILNSSQAPATIKLQYSDDGASWTDVAASWNMSGSIGAYVETEWTSVGAHAYWRVMSTSNATADGLGNAGNSWYLRDLVLYDDNPGGSVHCAFDVDNACFAPEPGTDMTLVSDRDAVSADVQPDEAMIVVWEEDVEPVTLNTDLFAYVSRDGGTTWSAAVLAEDAVLDIGRILVGTADLSGDPAGTSMCWKLTTANSKEPKLRGVGLEWR